MEPKKLGDAGDEIAVFISYSRNDLAVAEHLRDQLIAAGFKAYLDKHDIFPGEPWQERLSRLIETGDSVVFLLSPDSVASSVCDWEVNEAERLSKRILPVVIRDADADKVPGRLKRLNYIFMRNPCEEADGLRKVSTALLTDIDWIREHTRIGELSRRWERTGKRKALLLRGDELQEAELWARSRPQNAPILTDVMLGFLAASHKAEVAAQRATRRGQAFVIVLLLGIIGGLLAFMNRVYLRERYVWFIEMHPRVLTAMQERKVASTAGATFAECRSGCPPMVVLPAGTFAMGSPKEDQYPTEHPQRQVFIGKPFAVSKYEITFVNWQACVSAGACKDVADNGFGRGMRPVVNINWQEATEYAAWLSRTTGQRYRLLTEAEWEYAARAGSPKRFPFGDDDMLLENYAWFLENSSSTTHPVGQKQPNTFGIYDMLGNVWEWTEDCWNENYLNAPVDGSAWLSGDCSRRVVRGGSWNGPPDFQRSARRSGNPADARFHALGLRIARELTF